MQLRSNRVDFEDPIEAIESYFERGWTDGLPVIPPTPERVVEFLDHARLAADTVLAEIPTRNLAITAEKAAINSVMAGCLPEYFPVVVAAVEAIGAPEFNLHGASATMLGPAHLVIVNGAIRHRLGINCRTGVFGPGFRANATIGRAIRLILMNVAGSLPGGLDKGTFGWPGKFSHCIGEDEEQSPWPPLHVERGFAAETNAVTVLASVGHHLIREGFSTDAEGVLSTIAEYIRNAWDLPANHMLLVFGGEMREVFRKQGWTKARMQEFLYDRVRRPARHYKHRVRWLPLADTPDDAPISIASGPESFLILAAGGDAGHFVAFLPPWTNTRAVTRAIREA